MLEIKKNSYSFFIFLMILLLPITSEASTKTLHQHSKATHQTTSTHTHHHHPTTAKKATSHYTTHKQSHTHNRKGSAHHSHPKTHHHTVTPTPVNSDDTTLTDNTNISNVNNSDTPENTIEASSVNPDESLVSYIGQFMQNLRYTSYRMGGGIFDQSRGIYELDCSHYVDALLKNVYPTAYNNLVYYTGSEAPNSKDYYDFFAHLSSNIRSDWNSIYNAKDLEPGDILVFRYRSRSGRSSGGHVMVVMDKPVIDNDDLIVRVSDSASAGHSDDTRAFHNSGVGIGTLLLKIDNATGHPFAYAWDLGAPWVDHVNIDMGRPTDIG